MRECSECGTSLKDHRKQAVTCSTRCRMNRHRRTRGESHVREPRPQRPRGAWLCEECGGTKPLLSQPRGRYCSERCRVTAWNRDNPLARREARHRRRARMVGVGAEPFTARDLRRDWEAHDLYDCFFCGGPLTDGYEVEHFYALSKGGPHALWNLLPSCMPCNRGAGGKGTREPWGYLREALEQQGVDLDAVQEGVSAAIAARRRRR